jgi:hypothetical protein
MDGRKQESKSERESITQKFRDLLMPDDISVETLFVNAVLFQMMNIPVEHDRYLFVNSGFNFSIPNDEEQVIFDLPYAATPKLGPLLKFFDVSPDAYVPGNPLQLSHDFISKEFFILFVEKYSKLKEEKSDIIREYQARSRSFFEKTAIKTICDSPKKALKVVLPSKQSRLSEEFSEEFMSIIDFLLALESKMEYLESRPGFYQSIVSSEKNITQFIASLKDKGPQSEELIKILKTLNKDGIQAFARYHRTEAVLNIFEFDREMKAFLRKFSIDSNACDVIGDSLLRLAKVELGPNGKCNYKQGRDDRSSRFVFELTDISQDQATKLIQYVIDQGDQTVIELLPRPFAPDEHIADVSGLFSEGHSIEVDGGFLYNMMPNFMKELDITLNSHSELLKKYQILSLPYFAAEEKQQGKASEKGLPSFVPPSPDESNQSPLHLAAEEKQQDKASEKRLASFVPPSPDESNQSLPHLAAEEKQQGKASEKRRPSFFSPSPSPDESNQSSPLTLPFKEPSEEPIEELVSKMKIVS